jgi:hypothetical protein
MMMMMMVIVIFIYYYFSHNLQHSWSLPGKSVLFHSYLVAVLRLMRVVFSKRKADCKNVCNYFNVFFLKFCHISKIYYVVFKIHNSFQLKEPVLFGVHNPIRTFKMGPITDLAYHNLWRTIKAQEGSLTLQSDWVSEHLGCHSRTPGNQ